MLYVYILKSNKTNRYYIRHTENIEKRLIIHNRGRVRSTKNGIPWKVIYTEKCTNRSIAYQREMQIKKYKGGIQFKKLISSK
ncbi:MAG TPA: GIY-YIG nuclease family protein [Patescibacteria group bacterium]|nr:GIY-YIG nuclease family protein [Patescibacteria group bacterium]